MEVREYIFLGIGIFIFIFLLLVLASRNQIYRLYNKYLEINNHQRITGKQFAIDAKNGLGLNIKLALIDGTLTDCYSYKSKTLMMSTEVCESISLASLAIISHELGHAIQDHNKNPMFIFTNFLARLTNFTNKFILLGLIAGIILFFLGNPIYTTIFYITIVLFALHCLKNLFLIPVEKGASNFAIKYLKENKYLTFPEEVKVRKLLRVASRTYIANFFDGLLLLKLKKKKKRNKK